MNFGAVVKFSVVPLLSICIVVVPAAFIATGLDPFQYVLEEILGDPIYRSNQLIIAALLIRFLMLLMACVETFRSTAYLYILLLVVLGRWKIILLTPVVFFRNVSKLCRLHIEYRLLIKTIQAIVEALLYLVLSAVFWCIVVLTWICVKCTPLRIGYILYIWFVFVLCVLMFGVTVLLPQPCRLSDLDSVAVSLNILMAKKKLKRKRTRQNRILYLRASAVRPLRVRYGMFACLGQEFLVDFTWVLLVRCFDAIIIFHY